MSDHSHGPEAAYRRWGYAAEREQQRAGRAMADMFPEHAAPVELQDGDQRFTLREDDLWCRAKAGVEAWDLDVAACEESHLADRYFTKANDGLTKHWEGRVWCNPPFSDIGPWVQKAWESFGKFSSPEVIAMLLPASRTEQRWWQDLVEPFRDGRPWRSMPAGLTNLVEGTTLATHFLPSRTRFGHPGNRDGIGVGSPPFGCVLLVWRRP